MSKYYRDMSTASLRDELDRLEEKLSDLEDDPYARIGIENSIFYICDMLCRRE